ncbi:MAG: sugar-specific transcriptional regulator TrmB [Methanosarcinales archaeon]
MQKKLNIKDLAKWVISVDRRLVLMQVMHGHTIIKASDIAHETGRSTQNISHALKELEDKGLVACLTPDKGSWKKYILTELGREVLSELEKKYHLE